MCPAVHTRRKDIGRHRRARGTANGIDADVVACRQCGDRIELDPRSGNSHQSGGLRDEERAIGTERRRGTDRGAGGETMVHSGIGSRHVGHRSPHSTIEVPATDQRSISRMDGGHTPEHPRTDVVERERGLPEAHLIDGSFVHREFVRIPVRTDRDSGSSCRTGSRRIAPRTKPPALRSRSVSSVCHRTRRRHGTTVL